MIATLFMFVPPLQTGRLLFLAGKKMFYVKEGLQEYVPVHIYRVKEVIDNVHVTSPSKHIHANHFNCFFGLQSS